jgi:xanthine dehydrogenase small subunit
MPGDLSFTLNSERVSIQGCAVHTSLLDFIRDRGLTGAKEGCAEGECGACSVVVVAESAHGSTYRAINSCLLFLPMLAGREVLTVEALLSSAQLCAPQKAIAVAGGSQCGYCTPGFVMSLFAEYYRAGRDNTCDPHAMGGNLCRCTGYRPIRDAARSLGPAPGDTFRKRLTKPAPSLDSIHYSDPKTHFHRPGSVEECIELRARFTDAALVAGGTDMGVESNLRFRRWPRIISLESVAALRVFEQSPTKTRIGAALPLTDIAERWTSAPDALRQWIPLFASPTLRNRATLGGNLATASPIGDSAILLIALGAAVELCGMSGTRAVPVDSFFAGYRKTVCEPSELITAIEIPNATSALTRFYKVAKRSLDDISTVAAAFSLDLDSNGTVRAARFGFGGVAAAPLRAIAAEDAVIGHNWNHSAVQRAQAALGRMLSPIGDHRGSAEYRKEIAKSLLEKFWWEREAASA